MKKILVMPDGNWLSHTSRPFEIAKVLQEMEYNVIFAGEGEYMKLPSESGFRTVPIKTIQPDRVLACSRNGRANWYDYELISSCVEAELKLFDELQPDMVLTDFRLPLSTSCELARIPLAVILNASWTNYYTVRIKAPEHLSITRLLGKRITNIFIPWIKNWILNMDAQPFNRFRSEHGLPPRRNIWDVWRGDLNLIVDIPEYGPTENLPKNYHYIGPIVWEPDLPAPDWLNQLDAERPVLYFSMGSTGYGRFFEQAISLFGDTDYQCIMTTAGMVSLSDVPSNFCVVDYAPGSKIMEKADMVICHGGNGTIYQALSAGTPIIGIPTMHDQEFNLDRVETLGVGIHLSELNFQPVHLQQAVSEILNNNRFKNNAQHYQKRLQAYHGPQMGAELIDTFLQ